MNDKVEQYLQAERLYDLYKTACRESQYYLEMYLRKVESLPFCKVDSRFKGVKEDENS